MTQLDRSYSMKLVQMHREIHFTVSGFWDVPSMKAFLHELNECAAPLVGGGEFSALGDMRHGVPQTKDVAELIRRHLDASLKAGLTRVAVIDPPPLWKMQYERLAGQIEVAFVPDKAAALDWLRRPRELARSA